MSFFELCGLSRNVSQPPALIAYAYSAPPFISRTPFGNERSYLQELAYYLQAHSISEGRTAFNEWFAQHKAIPVRRAVELETSVIAKGFLSPHHPGFRFHYQKHYFLAAFLRDNPNRSGVSDYIRKLVTDCWSEDHANTALFLAYLQPSSVLAENLLREVRNLLPEHAEFAIEQWTVPTAFPPGFFEGLDFSSDPESNRRLLAERLDETSPLDSCECEDAESQQDEEADSRPARDALKSFHLIKLVGQLIRNAPIAFDGSQKHDLVKSGFDLSLRLVSSVQSVFRPSKLQSQAISSMKTKVLKSTDRAHLEAKLAGLMYDLQVFFAWVPLRHACHYLAHPELGMTYDSVLERRSENTDQLSLRLLDCGVRYELRRPNVEELRKIYRELSKAGHNTQAGQDLLRLWTSVFLAFNRVPVVKKQAIQECLGMKKSTQLLLARPAAS